jgi:hypothetical protein
MKPISFTSHVLRPSSWAAQAHSRSTVSCQGAENERIDTLTESIEFAYETILDLLGRNEALEEKTRLFEPESARR